VNSKASEVGFIQLRQARQYHTIDASLPSGLLLELVAISMAAHQEEIVYNILWIERQDYISYRRALGDVRQESWQVQVRENIFGFRMIRIILTSPLPGTNPIFLLG
jgi:hypothetical protein